MVDSFGHGIGVGTPVLFMRKGHCCHGHITKVVDETRCKCKPNMRWFNHPDAVKEGKEYVINRTNIYMLKVG